MQNYVKAKLRAGGTSIGAWVTIGHPDVAEMMSMLGFEWIIFDTEHSPLNVETLQGMLQAMSYTEKCIPIIRVAWNDMVLIKRALDIGAYGIVIPWVNSKEEAINAVRYCRYPPRGVRGYGPRRAALHDPEYVKTADEQILIIVQVETRKAIENLDEILSVEGIDVAFVGPWDLSMSLGVFGQFDSRRFREALDRVLDACERHGVTPGIVCTHKSVGEALRRGFRFCTIGSDVSFLKLGAEISLRAAGGNPRKA